MRWAATTSTLASNGNIANDGTILLTAGYTETLDIGGTLTNAADGTIQIAASGNGGRVIDGNVVNQGQVNVESGATLTVNESGSTTWNQAGGTLNAAGPPSSKMEASPSMGERSSVLSTWAVTR